MNDRVRRVQDLRRGSAAGFHDSERAYSAQQDISEQMEPIAEACQPGQQCEIVRLSWPARYGCPICPWRPKVAT